MRLFWLTLGWAMVITLIFLSLAQIQAPQLNSEFIAADKLYHFIAYFGLMFWFAQITPPKNRWFIGINLLTMSLLIEIIQPYTGRNGDLYDLLANGLGILVAWLISFKADFLYRYWFRESDL